MCVQFMKSPLASARAKVEHIYTGPVDTELAEAMFECDPDVSIPSLTLSSSYVVLLMVPLIQVVFQCPLSLVGLPVCASVVTPGFKIGS